MGMRIFSSSTCDDSNRIPNPNPERFKILQNENIGKYTILLIYYPDCTNYEGKKILVFENLNNEDLSLRKVIDPHFCTDGCSGLIARFIPTDNGFNMARKLCNLLTSIKFIDE